MAWAPSGDQARKRSTRTGWGASSSQVPPVWKPASGRGAPKGAVDRIVISCVVA